MFLLKHPETLISAQSSIKGQQKRKRKKKKPKNKTFPVRQKQCPMLPPPTHPRNTLLPRSLLPRSCENSEPRRRSAKPLWFFLLEQTVLRMFVLNVNLKIHFSSAVTINRRNRSAKINWHSCVDGLFCCYGNKLKQRSFVWEEHEFLHALVLECVLLSSGRKLNIAARTVTEGYGLSRWNKKRHWELVVFLTQSGGNKTYIETTRVVCMSFLSDGIDYRKTWRAKNVTKVLLTWLVWNRVCLIHS